MVEAKLEMSLGLLTTLNTLVRLVTRVIIMAFFLRGLLRFFAVNITIINTVFNLRYYFLVLAFFNLRLQHLHLCF